MNTDLNNILSHGNKDIDNQQLLDYLSQQISQANSHAVEMSMTDDAFVNDAVEGLQQFEKTKKLQLQVDKLNNNLQQQIALKKKRKEKRRMPNQAYTYFAVLLVVLLIIICFLIILKNKQVKAPPATPAFTLNQTCPVAQRFLG